MYMNELYHFGVKGMKWGVRRYQNSDGSLTSEGKKRMKADYKADNKKAFELGKMATTYSRAQRYSQNREDKMTKRYEKALEKGSKSTIRKYKDMVAAKESNKHIKEVYKAYESEAKAFEKNLMNRWGKDSVKSLKYDKNGKVDEKVVTNTEKAINLITSVGSYAAMAAGVSPVAVISVSPSKNGYGKYVADKSYANIRDQLN